MILETSFMSENRKNIKCFLGHRYQILLVQNK